MDMSDYERDGRYDPDQLFEIRMGLECGVNVSWYADPAFDADQMHMICLALTNTRMRDKQLEVLSDPEIDAASMREIVLAASEGYDLTPWAPWWGHPGTFNADQLREIRLGLKDGVDVSAYADPAISAAEMGQRRVKAKEGLHPLDKSMAEPLRRMEGKAACAWVNWQGGRLAGEDAARAESEYEATVRCMAMLTREPLHEVCKYVIDDACAMIEANGPSPTPDQIINGHGYFRLTPDGTLEPRQPKDNPFEALEWVLKRHADGSYSIPDMTEEAHAALAEASYSDFDDGDEWGSHAAVDELVARGWEAAQELERRLNEGITAVNASPKPQEATHRRPGPRR